MKAEDTHMVARLVAAGPHLLVNYRPRRPHGWPARQGNLPAWVSEGMPDPAR